MTPDENAQRTGLEALDATRRTLDEIDEAMQDHRWGEAAALYGLVGRQAAMGVMGCERLAVIKREMN